VVRSSLTAAGFRDPQVQIFGAREVNIRLPPVTETGDVSAHASKKRWAPFQRAPRCPARSRRLAGRAEARAHLGR